MVTDANEVKFPGEVAASAALPENSAIDLMRSQKSLCIAPVYLVPDEDSVQVGVDVAVLAELFEHVQRSGQGHAFLVGAVLGGQGFKDVGDAHDARLPAHLRPRQAFGVALAVHALVVAA